jgi:SAM-dependent methyltransferase
MACLDRIAFDEMIETQDSHWWFKGKRKVIERIINSLDLPKNSRILEIGCGTGSNIKMLSNYGKIYAVELDDYARDYAIKANSCATIEKGWLPDGLSCVSGEKFDVICMFDVLEHIEADDAAILRVKELLDENSKLIITVPAYQCLYSKHDREMGHFRRYNKKTLSGVFESNGYAILYSGYMNMFALPFMAAARFFDRFVRMSGRSTGSKIPSRLLNDILYLLFALESAWIPSFSSPFGGSVIMLARKS